MKLIDCLELAFVLGCAVCVAVLSAVVVRSCDEIRDLRKSEREAWEAYHELRATMGAMEIF